MTALLATLVAGLTTLPSAAAIGVDDTGVFDDAGALGRDLGAEGLLGQTGWSAVETAVDTAASASCTATTHRNLPGGHIAITGRGDFRNGVVADWYDGCGGDTCDDYIIGQFEGGGGAIRHFGLFERELIDYGLCVVDCYFDTHSGPIWSYGYRGNTGFYYKDPANSEVPIVKFTCGQAPYDANGWQFGGYVHFRP